MTIDWASVRAGGELRRLLKGDEFEAVLRHLQIDSASVKTATVFSSINSRTNSGLLLRGSFDGKEIGSDLRANGWREESLEGHKVYVNAADYVAMPASNTLFAGTREGAVGVGAGADRISQDRQIVAPARGKGAGEGLEPGGPHFLIARCF